MNYTCPQCRRIGIIKLENGKYHCPYLDCKYEGKDIVNYVTHNALHNVRKKQQTDIKLSCILAYAKSPDPQRDEALLALMHCFNNQTYSYSNWELIVVEHVRKEENKGQFPYKDLVDKYIRIVDDRPMNKSWIMNVGAREANYDHLIFHDADVLFGKNYLQEVANFIPEHKLFSGWSTFICMPGRDNPYMRIHVPKTIRCLIGAWGCEKDYYFHVFGGYNEDYFGYGREDSDIWHRATALLGKIPVMDYSLVHYYHNWHPDNGANPLIREDKRANAILERVMANPDEIRKMLLQVKIGNKEHPTLLHNMDYGLDKECNTI